MQLRKTLLVGIISSALIIGCSLFNNGKDATAISPLPKVKNEFTPKKIWSTSVGNGIGKIYSHLHPAFSNGILFAADRHGIVKAIETTGGNEKWRIDLSKQNSISPFSRRLSSMLAGGLAVSGTKIYVGSETGEVYALNTANGSVAWRANISGEAISSPIISDGIVLIHTSNGLLQALKELDGTVQWIVNIGMPSSLSLHSVSTPSVAFGAAIVGSDNGYVSSVSIQQGQIVWQQCISRQNGATEVDRLNDVDTTPVIVKGVVYALAYNGDLTALDLHSGEIIWKRNLGSVNDFIIDRNRIYLVDQSDRLVALSIEGSTSVLWTQSDLLHRNLTSPVIFNGYLITGDTKGYLHWINVDNGRFVAQHQVDRSGFLSAPLVVDGKLVIQARNGKVYAFAG